MSIENSEDIINPDIEIKPPVGFLNGLILAIISGIFYWLAFPVIDIWFLTFICWVPLIIAIKGQTSKNALFLGWATGITCNILGFYWLYGTIRYFGNFPFIVTILFMLIICSYQGARMGFMAWLYSRAEKKGWPFGISFVFALIASEIVYPLLFPWYTATHIHSVPVFMQLADIGGPVIISALLAGTSIAVAEFILSKKEKRKINKLRFLAGISTPLILLTYGIIRIPQIEKAIETFPSGKVGLVQGNREMIGDNADEGLKKYREASYELEKKNSPDFIVWPEGAIRFLLNEKVIKNFFITDIFKKNHYYGNFDINTPIISGTILEKKEK